MAIETGICAGCLLDHTPPDVLSHMVTMVLDRNREENEEATRADLRKMLNR